MQIAVYYSEDAPTGFQHVAHIINEQPPLPGKKNSAWTLGFHPVVFRAESAKAVREAAQSWWDAELERVRVREANRIQQSERMKARRAS